MDRHEVFSGQLAADITRSASTQTYYTIRFLADRERRADAYRAYGYFRWVDDEIDSGVKATPEKIAFAEGQKALLDACYRGQVPHDLRAEEWMLADLVRHDTEKNSGLQTYLRNMMDMMLFDIKRRGQVVSQSELFDYSHKLSKAVTEALYYFIGHDDPSPSHEARYLAVHAAHITHMLRDAVEDIESGYFNISAEHLRTRGISPQDITSQAYRDWVCGRVQTARAFFRLGRECTAQVKNLRCRLAGYAYTARFEWMLNAIERDHYCLCAAYPARKSWSAGVWMIWHTLSAMFTAPLFRSHKLAAQPVQMEKQ